MKKGAQEGLETELNWQSAWQISSPVFSSQNHTKLDVAVHTCNLQTREVEAEGQKFKAGAERCQQLDHLPCMCEGPNLEPHKPS